MSKVLLRDLQPGTAYAVQVRTNTGDSVSEWSRLFGLTTDADLLAPDAPTWAGTPFIVDGTSFIADWNEINKTLNQNKDFLYYELVFNDGTTDIVIRTTDTSYVLTFEENKAKFGGTPKPSLTAKVRSVDSSGNASAYSSTQSAANNPPAAPTAPAVGTVAEAGLDSVTLAWTPPADTDVAKYHIYTGVGAGFTVSPSNRIFAGNATRFVYHTTTYSLQHFKIRAVDVFGQESPDLVGSAEPDTPFGGGDTTDPVQPDTFAVTITDDPNGILLTQTAKATWDLTDYAADTSLAGFHIRYKENGTTSWNYVEAPSDPQQPFIVSNTLEANKAYDFEIRAHDRAGLKSAWTALNKSAVTPTAVPTLVNSLVVAAGGHIKSSDYTGAGGSTLGWKIDDDGVDIRSGSVRANTLNTGQIISTADATKWDYATNTYVADTSRKAFVIDLEGDAELNNVLVRGNIVVGALDTTITPPVDVDGNQVLTGYKQTIASGNYIPGTQGWSIRDDGYAEFQNVVANSFDGNAIKANTVTLDTLQSGNLEQTIHVKGSLIVENDTPGASGEGSTITLSKDGFSVKGSDVLGNPDYVNFPTNGTPNIISGSLQASTLTVSGFINPDTNIRQGATFRGLSHIELDSEFTLDNKTANPLGQPTFTEFIPFGVYGVIGASGGLEYHDSKMWRYENVVGGVNRLIGYNLTTGAAETTITLDSPFTGGGYNHLVDNIVGFTRLGSYWYVAFMGGTSNQVWLIKYNDSGVKQASNGLGTLTNEKFAIGNDGTNILLVRWVVNAGTGSAPVIYHYNPSTLAYIGGLDVTLAASSWPQSVSTYDFMFGVTAGEFDYGAGNKTYMVGFSQIVNNTLVSQVRAYNASGVRQTTREWPLSGQNAVAMSNGFAVNRSNNRFYEAISNKVYEFSGTMWTTQSSRWGAAYSWYNASGRTSVVISATSGNVNVTAAAGTFKSTDAGADFAQTSGPGTFPAGTKIVSVGANGDTAVLTSGPTVTGSYTITVAYETPPSPTGFLTVSKRRHVKVTGAPGPAGTVVKVYIGRNATGGVDPVVTDLHQQAILGGGFLTHTEDAVDFTTATPKVTGTFAVGTPGRIFSQQTYSYTLATVSTTSGSPNLVKTGGGAWFGQYMVGASITGTNIPADAKVVSVSADRATLVMDKNASATGSTLTMTFVQPSIELKGDGFVSVEQLYARGAILTATTDVNTSAGNMPPLRIGNINGGHVRMDGNEVQAMTDDVTAGQYNINKDGGGIKLGLNSTIFSRISMGENTLSTGAGGSDNIAHGMGATPDFVMAQTRNTGGTPRFVTVTAKTSTNFTVNVKEQNGTNVSSASPIVDWIAIVL